MGRGAGAEGGVSGGDDVVRGMDSGGLDGGPIDDGSVGSSTGGSAGAGAGPGELGPAGIGAGSSGVGDGSESGAAEAKAAAELSDVPETEPSGPPAGSVIFTNRVGAGQVIVKGESRSEWKQTFALHARFRTQLELNPCRLPRF